MQTANPRGAARVANPEFEILSGRWPILLIVLVGIMVYLNGFWGSFVFDDHNDVETSFGSQGFRAAIAPRVGAFRPVVALSFVANNALGGGFHAVNLATHLIAALTLYGIVRRTLLLEVCRPRSERAAPWLALAMALIWMVHPLQTECVTYVVHRYESVMGTFFLLTLYCVLRGATAAAGARRWYVLAVVCCMLGMGSKEVMVTAPLIVLLYDRTFLAGSWREALQRRWALYVCLAATWGLLSWQVVGAFAATESWAGFGIGVTPVQYALSQPGVILHYFRLALWPDELCIDYGWPPANLSNLAQGWPPVVWPGLLVLLLLTGTLYEISHRPWLGFLGAWFFGILATTSSFMPIKDLAAERRVYLSLAAVAALVVLASWHLLERLGLHTTSARRRIGAGALAVVVLALGARTMARNVDYCDEETLWRKVVAQRPLHGRGHLNLGILLKDQGRYEEAAAEMLIGVQIEPVPPDAFRRLGVIFERLGRNDEAIAYYRLALEKAPRDFKAHALLGLQHQMRGELPEAQRHYERALALKPDYAEVHTNLGIVFRKMGRSEESARAFRAALAITPDSIAAHNGLAFLLWETGDREGALAGWRRAISHGSRLGRTSSAEDRHGVATAENNLGAALAVGGDLEESMPHLRNALALEPELTRARFELARVAQSVRDRPDRAQAQDWLGTMLAREGKLDEALRQVDAALRADPKLAAAHYHRGEILTCQECLKAAREAYATAVGLQPHNPDYRCGLGGSLLRLGQKEEARHEFREALRADPAWPGRTLREAWSLAVHSDPQRRDGDQAVRLAQRVCAAVETPGAHELDVLAAAYAEKRRFEEAASTAQQAIVVATAAGNEDAVARLGRRLALYREHRPCRDSESTDHWQRSPEQSK